MARRTFAVIGLGRFGSAMAATLAELGQEVIGIDSDEASVHEMADVVSQAVQLDATDERALSLEEQLRRERTRQRSVGVTTYQWASRGTRLLVPLGGALLVKDDADAPARRAALAVDNARLYHTAQSLNEELDQRVAQRTLEQPEAPVAVNRLADGGRRGTLRRQAIQVPGRGELGLRVHGERDLGAGRDQDALGRARAVDQHVAAAADRVELCRIARLLRQGLAREREHGRRVAARSDANTQESATQRADSA